MNTLHHHPGDEQRPCFATPQKTYEDRPDRALCYPTRKRRSWMSALCDVVSLSQPKEKYWVNIWEHRDKDAGKHFTLRLKAKDDQGAKSSCCLLWPDHDHPSQYIGNLLLVANNEFRIELWEDARWQIRDPYLRVHFQFNKGGMDK